jgi:hypothetical protein
MSNADMEPQTIKPNEFAASGGSPPPMAMPPSLVEELATILADALVAEHESEHEREAGDRSVEEAQIVADARHSKAAEPIQ